MCGRFTLRTPMNVLAQQFEFDFTTSEADQVGPRYNIAPTQAIAAVRIRASAKGTGENGAVATGRRELAWLHWGLIPSWSKDKKLAASTINARGETVAEKPAFRSAFKSRRCLILADGYYEWQKAGKQKQPYLFRLRSEQPFALAGLWESWHPPGSDGPPLESCTIITTAANELTAPLHDRMPVILAPVDYALWLDPQQHDRAELERLLVSYPGDEMQFEPVSQSINNARRDEAP